jgi:protein gp37
MHKDWVVSLRNQCRMAGVAFFFKQWGGVRKKETGRLLEGRTYDEFPAIRNAAIPATPFRKQLLAQLRAELN